MTMLYERWQAVVRDRRTEIALWDSASGVAWTFEKLAAVADRATVTHALVTPRGQSVEFIIEVLRGWRDRQAVCPLESGQTLPTVPPPPPGCVHLKLTSATTGPARCVRLTADQLAADARNIVATMGLRPDWPNLGVISLAHSYGFSNLVTPLLLHGIPLALGPSVLPEAMRRIAHDLPDLTLPAVPALWRSWFEAGVIPPGVRLAISAGAPLPVALEQAIHAERGLKIHNFYGASECGGIAYDATPDPRTDASFAGRPLVGVEVAVLESGCLQVRGDAVADGYWPDVQAGLGNGGYLTSDLAEVREGQVYLRGRAGEVIHVAGRKVAPETIERVLAGHPAVRDCLVLGLEASDVRREQIIGAVVCLGGPATDADLRSFLLRSLPAWQVPREWWFVDSLAANARGKVPRAEWRQRWRTR